MGEDNSPYFDQGCLDGSEDALLLSQCPPGAPAGRDPSRSWSVMYNRGYDRTFHPNPCPCDGSCRKGKQLGQAPAAGQQTPAAGVQDGGGGVDSWGGGVDIRGGGVDTWA